MNENINHLYIEKYYHVEKDIEYICVAIVWLLYASPKLIRYVIVRPSEQLIFASVVLRQADIGSVMNGAVVQAPIQILD